MPGALSVKYATYVGYKVAGIPGAIIANLGNIIVPALLILLVMGAYLKYRDLPSVRGASDMIHLAVFTMIIAVAFKMVDINQLVRFKSLAVIVISFVLFIYTRIHPALIIIGAGILGAVIR